MQKVEIIREREEIARLCPFCYERIGMWEMVQLKMKKICTCPKCGRKIDKRNVWK